MVTNGWGPSVSVLPGLVPNEGKGTMVSPYSPREPFYCGGSRPVPILLYPVEEVVTTLEFNRVGNVSSQTDACSCHNRRKNENLGF